VTAAQRRLFDIWLNNPLDASVNASTTEFAKVFESPDTHEQIARHHKTITGQHPRPRRHGRPGS
jgi:hypothetical protein